MDQRRPALDPSDDEPLATRITRYPRPPRVQHATSVRGGLETVGDLYSDYTITCKDYTVRVHRVVLHFQSEFFAIAFSSGFREGQPGSSIIDLPEDDPAAIAAMIEFFYKGKYHVRSPLSRPAFHVKMLVLADKYEAGGLEATACRYFQDLCEVAGLTNEEVVAMVHAIAESDGVRRSNEMKEIAIRAMRRICRGFCRFRPSEGCSKSFQSGTWRS